MGLEITDHLPPLSPAWEKGYDYYLAHRDRMPGFVNAPLTVPDWVEPVASFSKGKIEATLYRPKKD